MYKIKTNRNKRPKTTKSRQILIINKETQNTTNICMAKNFIKIIKIKHSNTNSLTKKPTTTTATTKFQPT